MRIVKKMKISKKMKKIKSLKKMKIVKKLKKIKNLKKMKIVKKFKKKIINNSKKYLMQL